MRIIFLTLSLILFSFSVYAQKGIKYDYKICNDIVNTKLKLKYKSNFIEKHFKFNKDLSFSYYIDYKDYQHHKLDYNDSETVSIVPYQYVLLYEVIDNDGNTVSTLKMNCFYREKSLELERMDNLEDFLLPQMKVINGKALSLDKVLQIAKIKGYSDVSEWDIDYEKNKDNEYKWFFPRLIWTLKEPVKNEKESYMKVIQLNAKNGRVLKEFKEYGL